MTVSALVAASLALVLGQASWRAGVRGETRALKDVGADLLLAPDLALEYAPRALLLQASYDPDLLLREPLERGTFNVLHQGHALGSWAFGRDTRVALRGDMASGTTDLSWLAAAPDAALTSATRPLRSALVNTLDASSSLSLAQQVGRRHSVTALGRFSVSGGVGDARASLPRARTAQLDVSGAWVEQRDAMVLTVAASRGWVSNGRLTTSWGGAAAWRHAFTAASQGALAGEPVVRLGDRSAPRYELELAAGATVLGADREERRGAVPTASFTFRRDEAARTAGATAGRLTLRYSPVLDPLTGALTPRAEASAAVDVRLTRDLVALARGGGGWTIAATPPEPKLGQASAGVRYEANPKVSVSAEVRVAALPQAEWAGVVAVAVSQRGRL